MQSKVEHLGSGIISVGYICLFFSDQSDRDNFPIIHAVVMTKNANVCQIESSLFSVINIFTINSSNASNVTNCGQNNPGSY